MKGDILCLTYSGVAYGTKSILLFEFDDVMVNLKYVSILLEKLEWLFG